MTTMSSRLRRPVLTTFFTTAVLAGMLFTAPGASAAVTTHSLGVDLTAADLASALVGSGVTVSNAQFTGANTAGGTFAGGGTGPDATIGFDQGVILSSGAIASVPGPNGSDSTTTTNGQSGDADLDALLPSGQSSQDAAVLTFDFMADASSVSFQYVFSSEEYNEYVGSNFNDVFGFFVNGTNCATVDGAPVSVNTVNGGNPFGTGATNPSLFRNNDPNDPGPATIDTQMDGLTTVLTCIAPVSSTEANTMKLAIADVNDQNLDSNVFIEAGSLTTEPPVGAPTDVTAHPSDGSAIVTWTPPDDTTPIDTFEVTCTATDNPDDSVTVSVAGSESTAEVGGLTNGTEYTCAVRAHSGETVGPFSGPSAPFTPSDAATAAAIDPGSTQTVNLSPDESDLGTSGRFVVTAGSGTDPVILSASLFGVPGETDATCGGNPCVGQGIEWAFSDPDAIGKVKVIFFEDRELVGTARADTAKVYKDGALLPNCHSSGLSARVAGPTTCVVKRVTLKKGGWKIVMRTTGEDPKGRV
jgi:hypothetical protein